MARKTLTQELFEAKKEIQKLKDELDQSKNSNDKLESEIVKLKTDKANFAGKAEQANVTLTNIIDNLLERANVEP